MSGEGIERFFDQLQAVVNGAESLLKATGERVGEAASGERERIGERLRHARTRLGELEEQFLSEARERAEAADRYVHENPWRTIGIAAALAFALGALVGRRR